MSGTSVTGKGTGEAGKKPMYTSTSSPGDVVEFQSGNNAETQTVFGSPPPVPPAPPVDRDGQVKISPSDQVFGYLGNKLVAGTNVSFTVGPGPDENLVINTILPPPPSCLPENVRIVAMQGDDINGDGTECNPYATIGKALATITDASATKRYFINVEVGQYSEPGFLLKPFVSVIGSARGETLITSSSNIGLDPSFATTANARSELQNLAIRGAFAAPNFDLQAIGGGAIGAVIYIEHCSMNDAPVWKGRSSNDFNQYENSFLFNGFTGSGGQAYFQSIYFAGNASIDSLGVTDYMQTTFFGAYFAAGSITITNTTSSFFDVNMIGSQVIFGSFTMTGPANTFLEADQIPVSSTVGPGVTYTRLTSAFSYAYNPAVPANWVVQPVTIQGALDRIAAKIGPV
jgi:hypothetical protein